MGTLNTFTNYTELADADKVNNNFNVVSRFGDGSDGVLNVTSGTTNLSGNRVYNYTSINVSAGAILSTSDSNKPLILRCKGNCTIAGTIDLAGKGGVGGPTTSTDGSPGYGCPTKQTMILDGTTYYYYNWYVGQAGRSGGSADHFGGGGAGGGMKSAGGDGATGSGGTRAGGIKGLAYYYPFNYLNPFVLCGNGGAGGGDHYSGAGGSAGGAGGGGILIICLGNVTISGTINCNGAAGSDAGSGQGAGGGGSGGSIVVICDGTIDTTGGTLNVAGGAGGANVGGSSAVGGAGGAGYSCLITKTDWMNGVY